MNTALPSESEPRTGPLSEAWAHFDRKNWPAAAAMFEAAARSSSTETTAESIEAAFGLAHAYARQGNYAAAKEPLDRALTAAWGSPETRQVLTRAWIPRSLSGHALNAAKASLAEPARAHRPELIERLRTLALIYETAGDLAGTLLVYYALRAIDPHDTAVLVKMGRLWMMAQDNAKAASFFQKALARDPHLLPAMDGLADIAWIDGDVQNVRDLMARRAELSSDPAERAAALFKAAATQPAVAFDESEIESARSRFTKMLVAGPTTSFADPWKLALGPNFYVNYQGRNDRDLQVATAAYYLAATPSLGEVAPHIRRRAAASKYRIGMVSNYFSGHTIGYLNRGLILDLDRRRFEVVLFRTPGSRFDETTQEMAASARMIDLPPDLPAARRIIAEAELDILHYPEIGMDYFSYFLAFARLAKLQTVSWGHPVTTGIPNIDMFLSVDTMEPPDAAAQYSERLIRLRGLSISVARPVLAGTAMTRSDLGLEANRPAYVCAQSLYKIHHSFDDTLRHIVNLDRDGLIYFISHSAHADERFRERLKRQLGDDIQRIRLLPRVTPQKFLHLLQAADVLLDVPHWSGGRTSLEGFAVGTPIVHQPGAYMRGRHTLAFYRRMEITGTVVDGPAAYAETAARLVHDRMFRGEIRGQIAANSDRLFNDRESVREIESAWVDAFESIQ
ncbi:MAG: hypothetical protein EPO08_07705 [Rhodospirillaceae bacterium]|nr:MAG: hypothetical protein EPO08_07705 [Rhodospirillaceae bacterium]